MRWSDFSNSKTQIHGMWSKYDTIQYWSRGWTKAFQSCKLKRLENFPKTNRNLKEVLLKYSPQLVIKKEESGSMCHRHSYNEGFISSDQQERNRQKQDEKLPQSRTLKLNSQIINTDINFLLLVRNTKIYWILSVFCNVEAKLCY